MKFQKRKCKVLHLTKVPCSTVQKEAGQLESSLVEMYLGILVTSKFNMIAMCLCNKDQQHPDCISENVASRSRELILPPFSELMSPHKRYCIQFWAFWTKTMNTLEQVQQRATVRWLRSWNIHEAGWEFVLGNMMVCYGSGISIVQINLMNYHNCGLQSINCALKVYFHLERHTITLMTKLIYKLLY